MTASLPARLLKFVLVAAATFSMAALSAQTLDGRATHTFKSEPIPGRYIVVFKDDVDNPAAESDGAVRRAGGRRHMLFSRALKGFAATLPDAGVLLLRADPRVAYIEQDQTVSIQQSQSPATWGLDRIDQVDRPLDTLYHYSKTGQGVYAFIIDTGIRADHSEFTGRILPGYNTAPDANNVTNPANTTDCNGHGTHVSGTVGGSTWGVAKQVSLVPVRVLDCGGSGTWSGVIAGIDWVANSSLRPAVANMSLGGNASAAINAAVASAVSKGVVMVVAAGNESTDACRKSPASEPSAITVGASTSTDARASFSNYGKCVDLFAPGQGITSAWNNSANGTNTISGTSMATPHVTGVAALVLEANPGATPAAVSQFVEDTATTNHLASLGSGSPNLLLYSLGTGAPSEPTLPAIAVKSLTGKVAKERKEWRAQVTITLRNLEGGSAVANATVSGSFSTGGSGTCVTGSTSNCMIASSLLNSATTSTVFTVTNVVATGKVYDSSQNSASQITVSTVSATRR
ncbi:MAG: S8 family peptidase [Ramlibacter sp.]|nr:S8 family peptidase [Ramlibacter sp.]